MNGLIRIEHDLYDIAHRVREIDSRYELYFNRMLNRFEVHANGALQIAVPYGRLDVRTINLVRRTRMENASALIREMDMHNDRLEKAKEREIRDKIAEVLEEAV